MKVSTLQFSSTTDMFGTNIRLRDGSGSYDHMIAQGFNPSDPLKNMDRNLNEGYLFRSPGIRAEHWPSTLGSLAGADGRFNLTAELSEEGESRSVTAWVRFAEKDDAAMFAWSQTEIWQKWSDEKEAAYRESAKVKQDARIKVGKDGKITATVTVETLDK